MSKTLTWAAVLTVIIVIIWTIVMDDDGSAEQGTALNGKHEDMSLTVRLTTISDATGIEVGTDEPVFAIKNLNAMDWQDCRLTLNDDYNAHLDFIDTPTSLGAGNTTRDSMVVTERNFAKSDGTLFNPISQVPLKISIACSKPYLSAWVGTFNR